MSLTLERSPYMPVPEPPCGPQAPSSADVSPPVVPAPDTGTGSIATRPWTTPGDVVMSAFDDAAGASALDLDERLFDAGARTRPAPRPTRLQPIAPPASADEAGLRRQQRWAVGITSGFALLSVATLASWFV